jgi:hypothetical protein
MNSRHGSHAEVWAGGRGGGVCSGEPVATPREFAGTALRAYPLMVLRSMPVARAISLWLAQRQQRLDGDLFVWLQDVQLLDLHVSREGQFTSCPKGAGGAGLTTLSRSVQVEEFEVAMGGGFWVAVRDPVTCQI